jgi:flagellin-specific chaperone FliS
MVNALNGLAKHTGSGKEASLGLSSQNSRMAFISLLQSDFVRLEALMECHTSQLRSLVRGDAYEARQHVELDGWMEGAKSAELVHACLDRLVAALDTAVWAEERANVILKSRSLTRALTVVIAMQMSVKQEHKLAGALNDLYDRAHRCIVDSSTVFDAEGLGTMRDDFAGIREALVVESGRSALSDA